MTPIHNGSSIYSPMKSQGISTHVLGSNKSSFYLAQGHFRMNQVPSKQYATSTSTSCSNGSRNNHSTGEQRKHRHTERPREVRREVSTLSASASSGNLPENGTGWLNSAEKNKILQLVNNEETTFESTRGNIAFDEDIPDLSIDESEHPAGNMCELRGASVAEVDECVAVMVRFKWAGSWGGNIVSLGGTFNDWTEIPIQRSPSGDFVLCLTLEPGTYEYKFKVDDRWLTSLEEPRVSDIHNNVNNQVTVAEAVTYRWKKEWGGSVVYVSGTDSNWTERSRLEEEDNGDFVLRKCLQAGTYQYKFIVDGEWRCSPDEPTHRNDKNCLNNSVTVALDASVTMFYETSWEHPKCLIPLPSSDPSALPTFTEVPMSRTASQGWMRVRVPAASGYLKRRAHVQEEGATAANANHAQENEETQDEDDEDLWDRVIPALEFKISNGEENPLFDLAPGGGLYKCPHAGGYKLRKGGLTPFTKSRGSAIMVVSDLDGTMVGHGEEMDAGTLSFRRYWQDTAALAGGVLVFNTGRSIGQACHLFVEKRDLLAVPDVIITAVGTKIFEREPSFPAESTEGWKEDLCWAEKLEQGWDLEAVRRACELCVNSYPNLCSWLDRGTEHPHRCSLSIQVNALDAALLDLKTQLLEMDIKAKVIVSGVGEWRYVDCVAYNAGKLEALKYVRRRFGIPKERCAACGDSGNDILMLEGENPGIVVGNAQPDLRDWVLNQPQTGRIVLTTQSGANGILEGLASLYLF
mmetsp:Transcript_36424/g.50610  ORF Transcript_36424/g.50610 Transcript_36424/m.50610 type:complete len:748 (-) Transcript_36424:276-2519(-)|eukprot:CAMPEP_0196590560 /NCGR_PEP_ID=MMETSP1081-20130531/66941_1 /TAXON_ID=36882 /ORGANISM="Pyramimonas amylifera, Strain CCMP720" /LENGTH=747 /DNA_ID=CAMNT_0041913703 /DNA_START=437 /DNA_END=2680 /DNA_ORIENTATION=-